MNWVDLAVVALLAFSALLGLMRGLVREVLGLAAWAGAIAAAVYGFSTVRPWFRSVIAETDVADPVAFAALFLVALVVLSIVARAVGGLVRGSVLGGLDRTLGLVFGLARGSLLIIIAYIGMGLVLPSDHWPLPIQQARALPVAYQGAQWAAAQMPPAYRPKVAAPPGEAPPDEAALLRANPAGRATGPARR